MADPMTTSLPLGPVAGREALTGNPTDLPGPTAELTLRYAALTAAEKKAAADAHGITAWSSDGLMANQGSQAT